MSIFQKFWQTQKPSFIFSKKNAQRASTGFVISFNPPPKEIKVPYFRLVPYILNVIQVGGNQNSLLYGSAPKNEILKKWKFSDKTCVWLRSLNEDRVHQATDIYVQRASGHGNLYSRGRGWAVKVSDMNTLVDSL